ncbi:hypothetical protein AB9D58_08080 [Klebsiella michiganensis]|uniref:hypothetical protein n=1 Tax=Klebsiella michiganensis TaxID=1134687 RepID=UPI00351A9292
MNNGGLTLNQLAERNAALVTEVEKLRAERDQLAAENVGLKAAHPQPFGSEMMKALEAYEWHQEDCPESGMLDAYFILRDSIRIPTPATDAFLAGIKADGVEMFALMFAEEAIKDNNITTGWKARASRAASEYAELLREGAK